MTPVTKLSRLNALLNEFCALADEIYREAKAGTEIDVDCPADIAWIQKKVSDFYGVPVRAMTSSRRPAHWARARHVAMYLCRKKTKHGFEKIGESFGGRDHRAAMYSYEYCNERSAEFAKDFEQLEKLIG